MSLRNSIVSSASKVSPLQLRATQRFSFRLALKELQISIVSAAVLCSGRKTASVPPLSCCHPARASRATPQQKTIVFASGCRRSVGRGAQSEVVALRSVVSLPSLAHCHVSCSSTSWFLDTCLFTASTHCRGISLKAAVSQWEPSAAIKFMPLRADSIVFFFLGSRLRLMVSAPRQKLRLLSALHFAVLESVSQREPSESRPLHCVLLSPKHLPTMFRPRPPTPLGSVLLCVSLHKSEVS